MTGPATDRAQELRRRLRHHDPSQLWFQLTEIVIERGYLHHGVRVEEGATVFDVGANVGVAAAFFATECRAGVVHCFEPVAPIYELLRANLTQFPACAAHPYGLSDAPRRATITYYPGAAAMSGLYADPVADRELVRQAMTNLGTSAGDAEEGLAGRYDPVTLSCELRTMSEAISDLGIERIDLLKIDVERAELDVLSGIDERDWPRIRQAVIEVHDDSGRLRMIQRMLADRGFSVATDQEAAFEGTPVHLVYAVRPSVPAR
jgi:31-O-methyltransferase